MSINLRLPEGRFKIEKATIRNQEIRKDFCFYQVLFALCQFSGRILRRQEAEAQAKEAAEAKAKAARGPTTRQPKEEKEEKRKAGDRVRNQIFWQFEDQVVLVIHKYLFRRQAAPRKWHKKQFRPNWRSPASEQTQ